MSWHDPRFAACLTLAITLSVGCSDSFPSRPTALYARGEEFRCVIQYITQFVVILIEIVNCLTVVTMQVEVIFAE